MATIVTRASNGAPLSHTQMDDNFTNLNTDKIESTLAADLDTNNNAIKNTGGSGQIDIATRTNITQNIANNLLQLENQNTQGLGLSIKAGDATHPGSLAILSVADKDSNLRFIVKASGEVNVYDNLGVDSLYINNADATTAQISTINTGHDLNITTNNGTLSLNNLNWPASDGTTGQFLKTDGAGNLSFATVSAIENVVEDLTPQLGGDLDQNGNAIQDSTRNYQIIGNVNSLSTSKYDATSVLSRVHGVAKVYEIDTPTNRVHSHPTLTEVIAGANSSDASNRNAGRLRLVYNDSQYELLGFDNTTTGFGQGFNGSFTSAVARNSDPSNGASTLSQRTGLTITPQQYSSSTGGLTVTDCRAINMEPNINDSNCTVTTLYGLYYNRVGSGTATNEYSFYGNVSTAPAYNAGGYQLGVFTVSQLTATSPVQVVRNVGNMVWCSDESTGAQAVVWNGSNWVLLADATTSIS